jgi:outer membrane protein assembly factor BamA
VPFSQFIKVENEFKHYLQLGGERQLASRIIAGAGFAYGNSNEMPFIKQFFNGGTSIRLFAPDRLVQGVMMVHQLQIRFLPISLET